MITMVDANRTIALTSEHDTSEPKTQFYARALTLSQFLEVEGEVLPHQNSEKMRVVLAMVKVFPLLFARIENAGCEVDYEEREFGGKRVTCVSAKWVDEHLPLRVVVEMCGNAMEAQRVGEQEKKA